MKRIALLIVMYLVSDLAIAQEEGAPEKKWNVSADANFYFFSNDFILLPVVKADKNKLHLEARYNYEDLETFSAWVGYNIMGGNKFTYTLTPMAGVLVGNVNGLSAGLEMTFAWKGFELYTESENVFDFEGQENNFFYNWTDLTWAPKDWLWVGLSGQRTRLYQTDLDIQRGLLIGGALKNWELTGYLYNLGFDDPFVLVTLSFNF